MNQPTAHCANRTVHDADSHITEYDGWMEDYASEYVRDNLDKPFLKIEDIPIPSASPLRAFIWFNAIWFWPFNTQ